MAEASFEELVSVLESSKAIFWAENANETEQERQKLWNLRFKCLANKVGASSLNQKPASNNRPLLPCKRPMARTMSTCGPPPKRLGLTHEHNPTPDLHRTPSAPVMSRRYSSNPRYTSGAPVAGKGAKTTHIGLQSSQPPLKKNPFSTRSTRVRPPPPAPTRPGPFSEAIRDLSPHEYLASLPADDMCCPPISLTPSNPIVASDTPIQYPFLYPLSTQSLPHFEHSSPSTATSASMTRASTAASELMSRTTTADMICSPLDGLHIIVDANDSPDVVSNKSPFFDNTHPVDSLFPHTFPANDFHSSHSDHVFNTNVSSFPTSSPDQTFLSSTTMMRHSISHSSSDSSSSTSSSKARALRRTQEQNASATRRLAPKSDKEEMSSRNTPSARMVRVKTADGRTKEMAQISKATYNRPPRQKTFCPHCKNHPDGFHGDHELRRHIENVHADVRRVWICRDISPDKKFLSNCKACRNGKNYGANYNAAAHLRRTHFFPCKKGRGGRGKPNEKRGGKGGGDQPPMAELKHWMYETEVFAAKDGIDQAAFDIAMGQSSNLFDDADEVPEPAGSFESPSYSLSSQTTVATEGRSVQSEQQRWHPTTSATPRMVSTPHDPQRWAGPQAQIDHGQFHATHASFNNDNNELLIDQSFLDDFSMYEYDYSFDLNFASEALGS